MSDYLILSCAAFCAGLIDAIVGGGGLITVPVIFSSFPNVTPATLLGTNKLGAIFGTTSAAINYARVVKIKWRVALPGSIGAFLFSFCGAYTVMHVSADFLRKALPFVLVLVALYTFKRKDFGQVHKPVYFGRTEIVLAFVFGAGIGFYDGFFGPGTGSFLIFIFVRYFGFDFLSSSAISKIINVATNGAALLLFGLNGHVFWQVGLLMAFFAVMGSLIGSRLAIKHGSSFVRVLFLVVVGVLILKTFYDAYLR